MRIVVFTNRLSDLYDLRFEVISMFAKRGHEICIVAEKDAHEEDFINLGCRVIDVNNHRRGTNPFDDLRLFNTYKKILRQEKPRALLSYRIKPNIYGGIAARQLGIKYYPNVTGLGTAVMNPGILRWLTCFLYRKSLPYANCVFFQNKANIEFCRSHKIIRKEARIRLLPGSGVNIEAFIPLEFPSQDDPIRFLFIGRIMKDKGIRELLEAFTLIKIEYPTIELHILGSFDQDYIELVNRAEEEGLIIYHGYQDNVQDYLAKAHVVVLPSYHEGMSNTLLEAAASARPVIASDVPGCRETFDEGISGFSCRAKDSESLANAMRKFIALPYETKRQMGLAGRGKVEKQFRRELVVQAYTEEVLGDITHE